MPKGAVSKLEKRVEKGGASARVALKGRRDSNKAVKNDQFSNLAHYRKANNNGITPKKTIEVLVVNNEQLANDVQKALAFIMAQK
jgi:hypothetical protein|tara:strand:- start:736 stop:990 length:255 start_codon:yes stop_codon:yes gene_type:complete